MNGNAVNPWRVDKLEYFLEKKENSFEHIERLRSLTRTIDIFHYHLYEARDSINATGDLTSVKGFEFVLSDEFNDKSSIKLRLAIQANIQSSLYSARAIYDLFAQLLNSLLLDKPLATNNCDFFKLQRKLPESKLKNYLNYLSSTIEFQYVNAFLNTIKHRNLVSFSALYDFESDKGGVRFGSFDYNGTKFPRMWAQDVMEYSLFVKNSIVTAGNCLNQELGIINAPKNAEPQHIEN
ncbi:hypothetical protein [Thalassotalea euphylliae]|uniref:Uncharacterized protein n=1 Tax=Thalassotalea euphylliae TaxID=1655234 RepID=A0A3E0UKT0_9GAMM|nr:hypothetical protein [Thalassotalea euphylliae]REL36342.1 hypothetical protein DXX92_14030 [Thalassotalea euphylliae]